MVDKFMPWFCIITRQVMLQVLSFVNIKASVLQFRQLNVIFNFCHDVILMDRLRMDSILNDMHACTYLCLVTQPMGDPTEVECYIAQN